MAETSANNGAFPLRNLVELHETCFLQKVWVLPNLPIVFLRFESLRFNLLSSVMRERNVETNVAGLMPLDCRISHRFVQTKVPAAEGFVPEACAALGVVALHRNLPGEPAKASESAVKKMKSKQAK